MSANSKPLAPVTVSTWVARATATLTAADVASARLDAELIAGYALSKDRTWLVAHGDEQFDDIAQRLADNLLEERSNHAPLAYLFGKKEFYRRDFFVTKDVLIPRPESETIIDILKSLELPEPVVIHDVGTGSGCLGITAKLEMPHAEVIGTDVSLDALAIAEKNAQRLGANVTFRQDNLMNSPLASGNISAVVANLPYVDRTWKRSRSTDHEPPVALFADDRGLQIINRLIEQAPSHLVPGGYLLLEADPAQHTAIIKTGASHGLRCVITDDYIVVLKI